jgi:hypothetical protein
LKTLFLANLTQEFHFLITASFETLFLANLTQEFHFLITASFENAVFGEFDSKLFEDHRIYPASVPWT